RACIHSTRDRSGWATTAYGRADAETSVPPSLSTGGLPVGRLPHLTPSLGVATLALFVALGGSAFALSTKAPPVLRCGNGSVKAFAAFEFDTFPGAFPQQFSTDPGIFAARFSCNGKP